jgi:pyrimidine oxygenase
VFIGGRSPEEQRDASRRAKAVAADMGGAIRTYAMCTIIHADTDAKAEALVERYREGADVEAITNMMLSWGMAPARVPQALASQGPFMTQLAYGSPATCGEKVEQFLADCELDGLMLIFPDYVGGLQMFGSEILPRLHTVPA